MKTHPDGELLMPERPDAFPNHNLWQVCAVAMTATRMFPFRGWSSLRREAQGMLEVAATPAMPG